MDFRDIYSEKFIGPSITNPIDIISEDHNNLTRARLDAYKVYYTALGNDINYINSQGALPIFKKDDAITGNFEFFLSRSSKTETITLGFEEYYIFLEMLFIIDPKHDFIQTSSEIAKPINSRFDGQEKKTKTQRMKITRKIDKLLRLYDNRLYKEYKARTDYRAVTDDPGEERTRGDPRKTLTNYGLYRFEKFRDTLYKGIGSAERGNITLGEKNSSFEDWHRDWLINLMDNLPYHPEAIRKANEAFASEPLLKEKKAKEAADMKMAELILEKYTAAKERNAKFPTGKSRCAYLNAPAYDKFDARMRERKNLVVEFLQTPSTGNKRRKTTATLHDNALDDCCKGNGFSFIDGSATGACSSLYKLALQFKNNGLPPQNNLTYALSYAQLTNDTILYVPAPRCFTVFVMIIYLWWKNTNKEQYIPDINPPRRYYILDPNILRYIDQKLTAAGVAGNAQKVWFKAPNNQNRMKQVLKDIYGISDNCFDKALGDFQKILAKPKKVQQKYCNCVMGIETQTRSDPFRVRLLAATATAVVGYQPAPQAVHARLTVDIKYTGDDSFIQDTRESCEDFIGPGPQTIVEPGDTLNHIPFSVVSVSTNQKLPGGFEIGNTDITFKCRETRPSGQTVMQDIYTRFVTYFEYDNANGKIYFNTELHRTYPYIDGKTYENVYIVEFSAPGQRISHNGQNVRLNVPGNVEPIVGDPTQYKFTQGSAEFEIRKTQPLRSVSKHKFIIGDSQNPMLNSNSYKVQVNQEVENVDPIPYPSQFQRDGSIYYWAQEQFGSADVDREERKTLSWIRAKEEELAYYNNTYKCDLINTSRKAMCDFGQSLNMYLKTGGYVYAPGEYGKHITKGSPKIMLEARGIGQAPGKRLNVSFPGEDTVISPTLVDATNQKTDFPVVSIHNDRPAVVAAALLLKANNYKEEVKAPNTVNNINIMAHTCYPNANTYIFCNQIGNISSSFFGEKSQSAAVPGKRKRSQGGGGIVYDLLTDPECNLYCLYEKEKDICDIFFTGAIVFKYTSESIKIYNSYLRYLLNRSDKFMLSSDLNACAALVSVIAAMENGDASVGVMPTDTELITKRVIEYHNYRKIINALPYNKKVLDFFKINMNDIDINDKQSVIDYTEKIKENYNFMLKTMEDDIIVSKYKEEIGRAPLLKEIKKLKENINQRILDEEMRRPQAERDALQQLILQRQRIDGWYLNRTDARSDTTEESTTTNPQ